MRIPLGDLIGGDYFTGRGPRLTFRLSMTGTALTDLTSSFTSAGINQTRHELLLKVEMNLSVVLSDRVQNIQITTGFPVAETILKGEVPNVYGSGWGLDGECFLRGIRRINHRFGEIGRRSPCLFPMERVFCHRMEKK